MIEMTKNSRGRNKIIVSYFTIIYGFQNNYDIF